MIEAELPDGTVLEFPDGTDEAIVTATVKKHLGVQMPEAAAPAAQAGGRDFLPAVNRSLMFPQVINEARKTFAGQGMVGGEALKRFIPEGQPTPSFLTPGDGAPAFDVAPDDPTSLPSYMGQTLGAGLTTAIPAYGVAAAGVRGVAGTAGAYINPILDMIRSSPGVVAVGDLASTLGSGIGGFFGKKAGGPVGETLGQFAGAVAGGAPVVAGAAAGGAIKSKLLQGMEDLKLTKDSQTRAAARAFRGSMATPDETTALIETQAGYPDYGLPTTGEFTGDPGLLATQRSVARSSPAAVARSQLKVGEQQESLQTGLGKLQPPDAETAKPFGFGFFQNRVEEAKTAIQDRVTTAVNRARAAVQRTSNTVQPADASIAARTELDSALREARVEEKRVWGLIGDDTFDMTAIKERARNLIKGRPKTEAPNDTPAIIYQLGGEETKTMVPAGVVDEHGVPMFNEQITDASVIGDKDSFANLQALRSRLLEMKRKDNAAGNWRRAGKINEMLESIFEVKPADPTKNPGILPRWREARDFSRQLNDTFTRGPVGDILGFDPEGGLTTPAAMTLEKLVPPGQRGAMGVEAARGATQGATDQPIQEVLKGRFTEAVTGPEGQLRPASGAQSMRANQEALAQFPDLQAEMGGTVAAARQVANVEARAPGLEKAVEKSAAARYTAGDPDRPIKNILSSPDRVSAVKSLMQTARKDKTGQSVRAVQASLADEIFQRVAPVSQTGAPTVRAKNLEQFLTANSKVVDEVYGPRAMPILRQVALGADMASRLRLGTAAGGGSNTAEALQGQNALDNLAGVLGVIIGSHMPVGNSLMMAGKGRQYASKAMGFLTSIGKESAVAILEEALYDPAKARILLEAPAFVQSARAADVSLSRLMAFATVKQLVSQGEENGRQ